MMLALWILTLAALGMWSLTAWGLHAVLTLDSSQLSDLKPLVDQIPHADTIGQWFPGFQAILTATIDLTQVMLGWLGGAAPVIVWVLWGLGAAVIVGVALLLSVVIRLLRRRSPPPSGAPA